MHHLHPFFKPFLGETPTLPLFFKTIKKPVLALYVPMQLKSSFYCITYNGALTAKSTYNGWAGWGDEHANGNKWTQNPTLAFIIFYLNPFGGPPGPDLQCIPSPHPPSAPVPIWLRPLPAVDPLELPLFSGIFLPTFVHNNLTLVAWKTMANNRSYMTYIIKLSWYVIHTQYS